jgi:hypothetical protein
MPMVSLRVIFVQNPKHSIPVWEWFCLSGRGGYIVFAVVLHIFDKQMEIILQKY